MAYTPNGLYTAVIDQDFRLKNLEVTGALTLGGVDVVTALLLASGQVVDLNGEAYGLVLDADADTSIGASVDDVVNIKIAGAEDFRILANIFRALSGSVIETDTVNETTAGSGVVIDGLLHKDGGSGAIQAITGDGAITIQTGTVFLSKGSAAAITLAAPTATTHDYVTITIVSISAFAHVITGGVDGFNAKGSSGTATFGGAKGDSVTLRAYQGHWYTVANVNVTVA